MMQRILGFRGGGPPSTPFSSSEEEGSSPGAGARPLRLVYCDEKGKFQMDPEAVAALRAVKGRVGVVSVCGRARQGKSFILNQLLGRSDGFQVAPTHRPCTKGLWMWSAPLKRIALDGTEFNLLLLDSEGIDAYDQTGTYSTQIFTLAILLSSMFIYNQMGAIDEAALDHLSLVAEMTKHIRVVSSGRSSASELGQFSPVFIWLLRDFYLDLANDSHKITPHDYLELALRPMEGRGKDVSAKNVIRESIRALFPDRECFTLVRPLNNENNLQRLDQIPLDHLRPEFRSGLDALTKSVFERTRPKQVGGIVMTGPVLVGITQLYLDALNNGAVPTISSSWQSVEEAECLRAYELATDVYVSSFDRTKPPEEAVLMEAHEGAFQKSLSVFNSNAVGAGSARQKYEKLLQSFSRKAYERNIFLEADVLCAHIIQSMEKKLRAACHVPNAKLDDVIQLLDGLCSKYEVECCGPGKWQKLSTFLQQCLDGPIVDLFKRHTAEIESEKNSLVLKSCSYEEKLVLLQKQLDMSEKHAAEDVNHYEEAIGERCRILENYSNLIENLQSKCSSLEERCSSLSKSESSLRNESSSWKLKFEQISSGHKAEEDKYKAELAILKSRVSASEARLTAAREQAQCSHDEALEWRRKYDIAVGEVRTALERAAMSQERSNKKSLERVEALRSEFSSQLSKKEEEIKQMASKISYVESHSSSLISQVKVAESLLKRHELDTSKLKDEIKVLAAKLDSVNATVQLYEKEARILEEEKSHLEEKYLSDLKKFEEADVRFKVAERDAQRATELADNAWAEAVAAQKEKSDFQQLAIERLALVERAERQVESLVRERSKLVEEVERLHSSEVDALSKVALLESRVDEREREIMQMLSQNNKQRSNTVQVLESLLATERAARAEANSLAEALSLQLQSTQGKLDVLQQELTSVRLNETALDGKLRTVSQERPLKNDKRIGVESVQDMEVDEEIAKERKRSKSSAVTVDHTHAVVRGSSFRGDNKSNRLGGLEEQEDHTKFTVLKLKQELTHRGFGTQLLHLRNPSKKDILTLYEKHVLKGLSN